MAEGYFYDETQLTGVRLYGDPDVSLTHENPLTAIDFRGHYVGSTAPTPGMYIFHSGGGLQNIEVHGQFLLDAPQGLGELWGHDFLAWLGGSWQGELVVNNQAYNNAYFSSGRWSVQPSGKLVTTPEDQARILTCMCEYTLNFFRPSPYLAWPLGTPSYSLPAEQNSLTRYDLGDYYAGTLPLGADGSTRNGHAEIREITVQRPVTVSEFPRAMGGLTINMPRAREIHLILECAIHAQLSIGGGFPTVLLARSDLESAFHRIAVTMADSVFILNGNSQSSDLANPNHNEFTDCQLVSAVPHETHHWHNLPYTVTIRRDLRSFDKQDFASLAVVEPE